MKKNDCLAAMKKALSLFLTILMLLCLIPASVFADTAEEPDEAAATFEALVAANSAEAVLSRHENFTMSRSHFRDDAEIYSEYEYRDADTYFCSFSDGSATLLSADLNVFRALNEQGLFFYTVIYDTPEACASTFEDWKNSIIIFIPETELLLKTRDDGDGVFVAVTKESNPTTVEQQLMEKDFRGGYEYAAGMSLRYEYTFDKETGDLLASDTFLVDAEGESALYYRDSYAYDVEAYDPAAEGQPFAEYDAAVKDPEHSKSVTVVFGPDTDEERLVEYCLPNYSYLFVVCNGQSVKTVYTDRACTQLYESSNSVSELELFVR